MKGKLRKMKLGEMHISVSKLEERIHSKVFKIKGVNFFL